MNEIYLIYGEHSTINGFTHTKIHSFSFSRKEAIKEKNRLNKTSSSYIYKFKKIKEIKSEQKDKN